MQRFSSVLVGVDLTSGDRLAASELGPATRTAIERAKWLVEQSKAKLVFQATLELSGAGLEEMQIEDEKDAHTVSDAAQEVLDELVAEAESEGIQAESRLAFGRAWEEIIRSVLRDGHELVVCGTRDRSAASRLFFGGTSLKLLRHCPCPVWVTRPVPRPEEPSILVASDFGPVCQRGLELAVEAAQLAQAKVHLLHVLEPAKDRRMWLTGMSDAALAEGQEQRRSECEERLNEQLAHTDFRTLPFGVLTHVVNGPADVAILDAIDEFEIDLLVMGTVGRSGISGLVLGNTAERLLPAIRCSILALKPEGYVSPVTLGD